MVIDGQGYQMETMTVIEWLSAYSLLTGIILGLSLRYLAEQRVLKLLKEYDLLEVKNEKKH